MELNYRKIGSFITKVSEKNKEGIYDEVLGVAIEKEFMPSVANTIGTDLKKYNVVRKNRFAFNPMHVGRDEKLPIAVYHKDEPALVSPAYFMFEVSDNEVDIDYLMLVFKTASFDHLCWYHTDASVRGGLTWEDFTDIEVNIPSLIEQKKIVKQYRILTDRISLLEKTNSELEENASISFKAFLEGINEKTEYKLTDIADFVNGYSYTSEELQESSCGMVTIKNFDRNGGFKTEGYKSLVPIKKVKKAELKLYDVVIACTDLTQEATIIGNTEMVLSKGGYNSLIASMDIVRIDSKLQVISNFLLVQIMKMAIPKDVAKTYTKGTTVLHFDKKAFETETVLLPTELSELKKIEDIIENSYLLIAKYLDEQLLLLKLRNKLLANI